MRALTDLHLTLLVEAAAGTGKTALMAGRVTMLLASGTEPRSVTAITFTALAVERASVRGSIAMSTISLRDVFRNPCERLYPRGLTAEQRRTLSRGCA